MTKVHFRKLVIRSKCGVCLFSSPCSVLKLSNDLSQIDTTTTIGDVTCLNCLKAMRSEYMKNALETDKQIRLSIEGSFYFDSIRNILLDRDVLSAINSALIDAEMSKRAGQERFDKITSMYNNAFLFADPRDVQNRLERLCRKMNIKYRKSKLDTTGSG